MPPVCTGEHRLKGTTVSVIVIEFITMDGIVTAPADSFRRGDMHRLHVRQYRIMYAVEGILITIDRIDRVIS